MTTLLSVFSKDKRQVSFRINTLLSSQKEIEEALISAHISYIVLDFPKNCFLLENSFSEPDLWKLDIYKQGKIYIQGISSQVPVHFFKLPIPTFPSKGERSEQPLRILDACAAPGGKTSQLAALYPEAEIYAFEPQKIRFEKMLHNLNKLGISTQTQNPKLPQDTKTQNPILNPFPFQGQGATVKCIYDSVENMKYYVFPSSPWGEEIQRWGFEYFDIILVDAPCSGEWALHFSDSTFLENWSISHIRKNYARQKAICDSVLPYLKTGWELIYSTCTIAPEENEGVIHYLLCKYPELSLENIDLSKNKYINIKTALKAFEKYFFKKEISQNSIRVIPSEFSEWFYMAKLRKNVISNSRWSNKYG